MRTVADVTLADGGGMFAVRRAHAPVILEWVKLTTGYSVALAPNDPARQAPVTASVGINRIAARVAFEYPTAEYVGTWVDEGIVYVDPIRVIENREHAIRLGRFYGQLSIYDLAADKVLWLDGRDE